MYTFNVYEQSNPSTVKLAPNNIFNKWFSIHYFHLQFGQIKALVVFIAQLIRVDLFIFKFNRQFYSPKYLQFLRCIIRKFKLIPKLLQEALITKTRAKKKYVIYR